MKTLIIAEAGVNHNGDIELAKRLVSAAASAGADMVKFQTFSAERLVTSGTRKAAYQAAATGSGDSQLAMLSKLELTRGDHEVLIRHCQECGIRFFSTGFDIQSIDMLVSLGVDRLKIPSGEITNLPYLRHVGNNAMPVILSTGMATMGEIEAALDVLDVSGANRSLVTVLHCSTEYPAPMVDVNLRAMLAIRSAFGVEVGYSDHTLGIEVAIAAVALGATVIEKHFTLDRQMPGPDQAASLEPHELRAMVGAIRNVEAALGDGIKRPSAVELQNRVAGRKSLVAARPIRAGDVFCVDNITSKRPGNGISPMCWDRIMGRIAFRDFSQDELIEI